MDASVHGWTWLGLGGRWKEPSKVVWDIPHEPRFPDTARELRAFIISHVSLTEETNELKTGTQQA
jgi:hypothetical protein